MFVTLSKILPLLVYPVGLVAVLLALALVFHNRPRWRSTATILALVVLFLSGNSWTALSLARSLEWRYLPPQEVPQAEAIVLLGGGTEPLQYPRPEVEINSAGDRVLYAARLYKEGKAPLILLSGGSISWLDTRSLSAAGEMADVLKLMGIPEQALVLQTQSQNTYEDALYCKKILDERGIHRILLVTSAMHMPRSVSLFRKQGLEVIPVPTDYNVTQAGWDNLTSLNLANQVLNLIPNVGNMSLVSSVLKEYIGMLVYKLRGWI